MRKGLVAMVAGLIVAMLAVPARAHTQGGVPSTAPPGHLISGSTANSLDDDNGNTVHCYVGITAAVMPTTGTRGMGASCQNTDMGEPGYATPTLIQQNSATVTTAASSLTVTFATAPVEDNLMVVTASGRSTCTDIVPPGSWSQAVEQVGGGAIIANIAIGYKIASNAEPSEVTVTASTACLLTVGISEWSGIDATNPFDKVGSATSGATAVTLQSTGNTGTLSQANELVIAAVATNGNTGLVASWDSPWNSLVARQAQVSAALITASTASVGTIYDWTGGTARNAVGAIASFRAAISGSVQTGSWNYTLKYLCTGGGPYKFFSTGDYTNYAAGKWRGGYWSDSGGCGSTPIDLTSFEVENCAICVIEVFTGITHHSAIPVPPDYFYGGSVGDIPPDQAVAPVLTCDRTLERDGDDPTFATLRSTITGGSPTGITTAFDWDFGDGTAHATVEDVQHDYGPLQPEGGWTATVTATFTAPSGYAFGNQATTTATCALRMDWDNPSITDPTDPGVEEEDNDCPSGFGWLNPSAIVTMLKCLFIPSAESVQQFGDLWGDMTTKAPFSWAYEVIAYVPLRVKDIYDGAVSSAGDCYYLIGDKNPGDANQPGSPTMSLGGHSIDTSAMSFDCNQDSALDNLRETWAFSNAYAIMTILVAVAFAIGVYKTVVWVIS